MIFKTFKDDTLVILLGHGNAYPVVSATFSGLHILPFYRKPVFDVLLKWDRHILCIFTYELHIKRHTIQFLINENKNPYLRHLWNVFGVSNATKKAYTHGPLYTYPYAYLYECELHTYEKIFKSYLLDTFSWWVHRQSNEVRYLLDRYQSHILGKEAIDALCEHFE